MKFLRALSSLLTTAWLAAALRLRKRAPPGEVKKILILGYAAMGDLLFFMPVIEGLRRHYPGARLTFLATRYMTSDEILPASGLIDDYWLFEWEGPEGAGQKRAINRRIHEAGFDLAVLTLSSPGHYFQWGLRGISLRVGHWRVVEAPHEGWWWPRYAFWRLRRGMITGEWARRAVLNCGTFISRGSEHALPRNLRLLSALGLPVPHAHAKPSIPLSAAHRDFARSAFARLDPGKKRVGVHLGPPTSQYHKFWNVDRFARLCALVAHEWNAEIVLVGGADEEPNARRFHEIFPAAVSWVGRSSILQTFALIERCDLFLTNDAGPAKAAMAMGVPTATIYGPSDPAEIGVLWDRERHLDIRTGIACSPCARLGMAKTGSGVLNYSNCGHHDCLAKLDVDFAFAQIKKKYLL